jgi:hypothetical protein
VQQPIGAQGVALIKPYNMQGKQLNFIRNVDIIRSISFDEHEILEWIIELHCPQGFELDPTYSTGRFYSGIPQPKYKFDIDPRGPGVIQADVRHLPVKDNSINSIMFDPPFVIKNVTTRDLTGIVEKRFSAYPSAEALYDFYYQSIKEFQRILIPGAVLVFKCQDTIDSGRQYLSHVQIVNMAEQSGFYTKDLFILCAHKRIISQNRQFHARKYHSYFLVFLKR